jgi:hypothetical protein
VPLPGYLTPFRLSLHCNLPTVQSPKYTVSCKPRPQQRLPNIRWTIKWGKIGTIYLFIREHFPTHVEAPMNLSLYTQRCQPPEYGQVITPHLSDRTSRPPSLGGAWSGIASLSLCTPIMLNQVLPLLQVMANSCAPRIVTLDRLVPSPPPNRQRHKRSWSTKVRVINNSQINGPLNHMLYV